MNLAGRQALAASNGRPHRRRKSKTGRVARFCRRKDGDDGRPRPAKPRFSRSVRLDFNNSAVGIQGIRDVDTNGSCRNGRERKLSPDQIISADTSPRDRYPADAIPVLNIEVGNSIKAECHRRSGL